MLNILLQSPNYGFGKKSMQQMLILCFRNMELCSSYKNDEIIIKMSISFFQLKKEVGLLERSHILFYFLVEYSNPLKKGTVIEYSPQCLFKLQKYYLKWKKKGSKES